MPVPLNWISFLERLYSAQVIKHNAECNRYKRNEINLGSNISEVKPTDLRLVACKTDVLTCELRPYTAMLQVLVLQTRYELTEFFIQATISQNLAFLSFLLGACAFLRVIAVLERCMMHLRPSLCDHQDTSTPEFPSESARHGSFCSPHDSTIFFRSS